MIARFGLVVVMFLTLVPAVDLPETSFDESDTSINIAVPQPLNRNQLAPASLSAQVPVPHWIPPRTRPERVLLADSAQRPGTRVALALLCTFLC